MGIISLCEYCHRHVVTDIINKDGTSVIACINCYQTVHLKKVREEKLDILFKETKIEKELQKLWRKIKNGCTNLL
jgi:Zn-finger protein